MDQKLEERTITGLHSFLEKKLPVLGDDASILDVGCGSGAWLKRLNDTGYRTLAGVDIEVPSLKTENITLHKVDLDCEGLPFEDESFGSSSFCVDLRMEPAGLPMR